MRFNNKRILMKAQNIVPSAYLDIIFHNRNKQYGSYAIRKHHDKDMVKSFLVMVLFCSGFVLSGFLPDNDSSKNIEPHVYAKEHNLTDVEIIKPPKPVKPRPAEPPKAKPTIKNPVPVIKPDDIVTEVPPPIDSFEGRESGPTTVNGESGGTGNKQSEETGSAQGSTLVTNEPLDYTEVMPEFRGDIYSYLAKTVVYPQKAISLGIEGRVLVQFVINEDGEVGKVELVRGIGGGCDEEALRVVSQMPSWKPGLHHGKPVRVNYKLPIAFRLE